MAKRLTTAGWLAGIWLSAYSIWGCPIPTATVAPTTVCVGAVSEVMAGYIPGDCPPVGDPWISALNLNTNGLNPPAGGTIDLPSATVTWTNTGYAWLKVESSVRYQSGGGPIMTNTSTSTFFFTVLKMEIAPSETNVCWKMTNTVLSLTADSFWGEPTGGSVVWTSAPAGLGGVGYNSTNFWFNPSNSTPTAYVVRAWSSLLTNCQDACTLRVWRLEIAPSNAFVCWQTNSFTFGLTNSYWGGSSVIWTSAPAGLSPAGGSGATFEINPSNSVLTNYTITACIADRTNCAATGTLTVLKVEIKKPSGDPSLPAGTGGANQWNERTYNGASPGVVTVVCEAEDTPNTDKLRWTIEDVGEIQASWEPHVDGNVHVGAGSNPTATFTGLPAQYNAFGSKTITLTMDEPGITTSDTQEVEIFFARSASNHSFLDPNDPKQEGPNWYYYSLQILPCVADNWGYIDDDAISPAWKPMYGYTQGWIVLTPDRCPGNPFYYIAHENKHHTDFFQEIWQGTGYEETEDDDKDGIRDDFEIDHYGNLDKTFDYIMQEDWSEPRANAAGNAASGDTSNWNKYWCDPGTLKGYQP